MKVLMIIALLFCTLSLIAAQIFYPAIKVNQIGVLQNGNVTVVPFVERASPLPLVLGGPAGRRFN